VIEPLRFSQLPGWPGSH